MLNCKEAQSHSHCVSNPCHTFKFSHNSIIRRLEKKFSMMNLGIIKKRIVKTVMIGVK